jgi:release factor glutamine methyltransferase
MTLGEEVRAARARLVAARIDPAEAAMDAELLARHVLGWDRARFLAEEREPSTPAFRDAFRALVARRASREPVSCIVGHREFWGLDFAVTPAVLAPRPETEIIVEEAVACLTGGPSPIGPGAADALLHYQAGDARSKAFAIADVGTGTGCLAISLAVEFEAARIVATDISAPALAVAAANASRHGVSRRIAFRETSLLDGAGGPFDLVVSNPPYVPAGDIPGLPPEVVRFEPLAALDGGPDGLDVVRALLPAAERALVPGGWLIFEFGYGQDRAVRESIAASPMALVRIREDLQRIPRTAICRKERS